MSNIKIIQMTEQELAAVFDQLTDKLISAIGATKAQTPEQSDLIDLSEASKVLNLAPQTIYGMVSKNTLPHMKRGKKLYFSRKELTEWIQAGRKKTVGEIANEAAQHIESRKQKRG